MATLRTHSSTDTNHTLPDGESLRQGVNDGQTQTQNRPSIRNRQRRLLGNFHFQTPLTPQNRGEVIDASREKSTPNKRREQALRAQREHRKRTHDYISALEEEVMHLRSEGKRLQRAADDWKQCAMALIQPAGTLNSRSSLAAQFGPGVLLWVVRETPEGSSTAPSDQTLWNLWLAQQLIALSSPTISPCLDICSASSLELLRNFCDNIAPSLNLTEASADDYARRIIPLALSDEAVQNSFLAASASHIRATHGAYSTAEILKYRSAAIRGLQKASTENLDGTDSAVPTLATILGLLIDDMINNSKEYPILVRLVDSWKQMTLHGYKPDESSVRFLLDQIQMIKTLVHPLYQFNESHISAQKMHSTTDQRQMTTLTPPNLRNVFSNLQSAMTQACYIHNLFPATSSSTETPASSAELKTLLERLQSTLMEIPPFSPGENQLIWVCTTAVSRSARTDQSAFFMLRLAELLHRAGYSNIPEKLALARSSEHVWPRRSTPLT